MRPWQLLDFGERLERVVHNVSCGDVQREQRVDCVERMLGLPCGGVLLGGLQLVGREWGLRGGQLVDCGQRHYGRMQRLSCWGVLPCGLLIVEWERRMCSGQLLDRGQRHQRIMHSLSRRSILPRWLWEQWWQRGVRCRQFLIDWVRCFCFLYTLPSRILQFDRWTRNLPFLPCWKILLLSRTHNGQW